MLSLITANVKTSQFTAIRIEEAKSLGICEGFGIIKRAFFLMKSIISSLGLFIGLLGFQTLFPNFSDWSLLVQIFNLLSIIFFGAFIYFGLMFVLGLRMSFFKN